MLVSSGQTVASTLPVDAIRRWLIVVGIPEVFCSAHDCPPSVERYIPRPYVEIKTRLVRVWLLTVCVPPLESNTIWWPPFWDRPDGVVPVLTDETTLQLAPASNVTKQ